MKKTVVKFGEFTIESDGTVDIEIDGNVIRVKGTQPPAPTFELKPSDMPSIPGYPWKYEPYRVDPNSTGAPLNPGVTWRTTCSNPLSTQVSVSKNVPPITGSWYVMTEEMKKNSFPTT